MKKILVLNLTRLGDLIQSTPLITGLKRQYPGCELTLLGEVHFAGILKHLADIDNRIVFDVKQFIEADDGNTSYLDVYRYLDGLIDSLKAQNFDMMVNLSHSKLSALIGKALDIRNVRGVCSTPDGFKVINDPWLMYFNTFVAFRLYNSFNLVDIYQLGGGVKPDGRRLLINHEEPSAALKPFLSEHGILPGEKIIGLQAGASLKVRRWPPEKFAAAADMIAERKGARILLFGAEPEKELVDEVDSHMKTPAVNLAGKTTLEQLIGLVKRCNLLVTNDTVTMHIAAAVGTPVVALFLAHAYSAETGPCSEGSIVIEPDISCFPCPHNSICPHYACLERISPKDVADAADILPEVTNHSEPFISINTNMKPDRFTTTRLYTNYFDEPGFIDLMPLKKERLRETEIFSRMYRYLFVRPGVETLDDNYWMGYLKRNFIDWPEDQTLKWIEKERRVFEKLESSAGEAMEFVSGVKSDYMKGKLDRVKKCAAAIQDFDRKIAVLAHTHEELMPLVALFDRGKQNITDSGLEIMFEKTRLLYAGMRDSAREMARMLDVWGRERGVTQYGEKFVGCVNP
ncbi:MAG: heptosyltransferase [bacterium]|nr:MAG: heptosyltransferase [bacterium]